MRSLFFRSLLLVGGIALGSGAKSGIIFSDDFSGNTPGVNSTPQGWTIANAGGVDILGTCNSIELDDLIPGNNCYIDLTSDVGPPGEFGSNGLLTRTLFLATGHSYIASFDLGGNNVNPFTDTVTIGFGGSVKEVTLNYDDQFVTSSIVFSPGSSGLYDLSFINSNIDYHGALLDNIRVEQVPGPLPFLGVGSAFAFRGRLRSRRRNSSS
jgi:hypothetical protein